MGEDEAATRYITCVLCEASCGLQVTMRGEQVESIRGHREDPLSRGHVCPKAIALQDLHTDPDRLRHPVRRTPNGWQRIGWDEAVAEVVERLGTIQDEHGNDAVAAYLGNPNVHSLGAMTHGVNFVRVLSTRNTYSATSIDQLPHQLVSMLLYGHQFLVPIPDLDRTHLFVEFGGNPMASNGSIMTVPDFPGRLRELHARGGRMVVFDPRRTETAAAADDHYFIRPGTDAFVLLAIVRTLLDENLTRPAEFVDGIDQVRRAVAPFTPDAAERASGVPAQVVSGLAREIAAAPSAAVHGRLGVSTQQHGTVCQWAIHVINALTGNLDRPGGVMFTAPAVDPIRLGLLSRGHLGRWHSRVRGLPEFGGELPVSVLAEEIATPGEGQVRGLVTLAGNPVLSTPAGHRLDEALAALEFMVSVDFYVNETTRHADIILPPTGPLEREHYDLVFHMFAVRNTARWSPALFEPADGARHDWEIYRDLGLALQARRRSSAGLVGRLAGAPARVVDEARLRTSPATAIEALLRVGRNGLSVNKLRETPGGVDLGPLQPCLPGRLRTENKRVDLAPTLVLDAVADLAARAARPSDEPAPGELLLIGRRHQRDINSWLHNQPRLTKGRARHRLLVNPADLAARGLTSGAVVTVRSAAGQVQVECEASEDMMPGVVSLPHGYGHSREGVLMGNAVQLPGVSVNDLTDPNVVESVGANAVVNGVPVTLT